ATKVAYGPVELDEKARAKSRELLETNGLLEGLDDSKCWYCGKEKASHQLAVTLTRPARQREGQEQVLLGVPACGACKGLFARRKAWASLIMNGIMWPTALAGLVLGLMTAAEMYQADGLSVRMLSRPLIGLLVGFGLSAFVASFLTVAVIK